MPDAELGRSRVSSGVVVAVELAVQVPPPVVGPKVPPFVSVDVGGVVRARIAALRHPASDGGSRSGRCIDQVPWCPRSPDTVPLIEF